MQGSADEPPLSALEGPHSPESSLELCNFNDEIDELDRNHFHENKKKIWDAVEMMVSTSHALP